jgi:hypothetical protein
MGKAYLSLHTPTDSTLILEADLEISRPGHKQRSAFKPGTKYSNFAGNFNGTQCKRYTYRE